TTSLPSCGARELLCSWYGARLLLRVLLVPGGCAPTLRTSGCWDCSCSALGRRSGLLSLNDAEKSSRHPTDNGQICTEGMGGAPSCGFDPCRSGEIPINHLGPQALR